MNASGSGRTPGNFVDRRQYVERLGIAVRILAIRERLGLLPPLAARDVGEQLEQHIGRGRERDAIDQRFAQRASADREIRRRAECRDNRIGEFRIVGGENAE